MIRGLFLPIFKRVPKMVLIKCNNTVKEMQEGRKS